MLETATRHISYQEKNKTTKNLLSELMFNNNGAEKLQIHIYKSLLRERRDIKVHIR